MGKAAKKKQTQEERVTLKIVQDDNPMNPRTEFSNLGTMACWHRRSNLGDTKIDTARYANGDDWLDQCVDKGSVVLPLYLYEHGGMTMSTGPFGDRWDSGQVGWIYCEPDAIVKEYSLKDASEITDDIREKVKSVLESEVKTYDHMLTGNVWGYVLEKHTKCECCGTEATDTIGSCWGFYGDELDGIGIEEHIPNEYQGLLQEAWENRGP